jgi:hypothetical protein
MICPRCRYESAYSMGGCPRCGTPWRADPIQTTGTTPIGARRPDGPWAPGDARPAWAAADARPPGGPWAPAGTAPPADRWAPPPADSWAPPGGHPPGGAPRHGGHAEYTQPPAQAFSFDATKWTTADRVTGAASLVLLISLFLPWFTLSVSFGPLTSHSSKDGLSAHSYLYLVLFVSLLIIGYLVVRAGKDLPALRGNHERLLTAAAGINLLLVLIGVVFKPGPTPMPEMSWSVGAFVGLIAAIVAVAPLASSALRARQAAR